MEAEYDDIYNDVDMLYNMLIKDGRVGKRKLFYNTLLHYGYTKSVAYKALNTYCQTYQVPLGSELIPHVAGLVKNFLETQYV